jgi:diacylglycerol kinase (ATP)
MADSHNSNVPRSPFRIWQAFRWSMQGLKATWQIESSFRLEVYLFIVLAPLGLYLGQNPVEQFLLVSVLLLVLIVEVLNSAIEAVVDRWGPEFHDMAGRAKDMGSAAVFLSDVNAVACWVLVLWPAFNRGS